MMTVLVRVCNECPLMSIGGYEEETTCNHPGAPTDSSLSNVAYEHDRPEWCPLRLSALHVKMPEDARASRLKR